MLDNRKKISKKKHFWSKKKITIMLFICLFFVVAGVVIGYPYAIKLIDNAFNKEKLLSVKDLENPDVMLNSKTSNESVESLKHDLGSEIDEKVKAKKNPIDEIKTLSVVLYNTSNKERPDQLINYLEDFLTNHENELWYRYEYSEPDQAQVNFWKSELYSYLINYFQYMIDNNYIDSDDKLKDVLQKQLKYIDLYLNLASAPESYIDIPEEQKEYITNYIYDEQDSFLELKNKIIIEVGRYE